ncbi:hypothetical protein A1Q2_04518 [Trichosporon asahii var. asahii CBS 8904]|jgi:hypothetical protein|uniref:Uncharacterized protein n=1 Tax=Trichosporon asahii var. asahii (strain CBS 8904) TaxID=1220162 RepID=K1VAZ4_TRIAC|nr:hypothetical protein A1Q2_04518 [Trichosporon asahii var. asahii CBS 8904]
MSPTSLDPSHFPHLFDIVIAHLYHETEMDALASLRATNSALRDLVDRRLATHVIVVGGGVETFRFGIWRDEWKDGHPLTRVVDFHDMDVDCHALEHVASPSRFLRGSYPTVLRELGNANANNFWPEHPCKDFTFISVFDSSKGKPITNRWTLLEATNSRNIEIRCAHSIVSVIYHHGYGFQIPTPLTWNLNRKPIDGLEVTIMIVPHSAVQEAEYPPETPIVYRPCPQISQLNELVANVVVLLEESPMLTVRIVGSEYWEEAWWDPNFSGVWPDEWEEAVSADTEEERVMALWEKLFDAKAESRRWYNEERHTAAKKRVSFIPLTEFKEQVGEEMFELCIECDYEYPSDDESAQVAYDSEELEEGGF